ncbi:MAG TPA: hypothetical protein VKF60_17910 [Myxococcota bacterium]|nr:hypothetical protein [Myxococcota bacterium]
MERQKPDTETNEIALYLRTVYSLLRSTGEVRVRAFEEAHSFSNSSLHLGARDARPDVGAFGYAAARLPACMPQVQRIVLGQSDETFADFGFQTRAWQRVRARGRRRMLRWDGAGTLAAFVASTSDIDDLVPILTAYQIEWNKMHELLAAGATGTTADPAAKRIPVAEALDLPEADFERLREALGSDSDAALRMLATKRLDLRVRLLAGSFSAYERAAQHWWHGVERVYVRDPAAPLPPVYFVSSNTHSLANLLGGYALAHRDAILSAARRDPRIDYLPELEHQLADGSPAAPNLLYFALRHYLHSDPSALARVQQWDEECGISSADVTAQIDVQTQVIELARVRPERFDPRLRMPGLERLAESDAWIINIDYPLGLAAYHLLSRVGQGAGPLLGAYVMGKAATLNGQVGDVMISRVVHDEHSDNTYLIRNAFGFDDLAPWLEHGSVLDNQKAVTVRGAFLQNPNYMGVFYREGYTVLEMEAGPYLSAIFELVDPRRHPNDEIVALSERTGFALGVLHYASDTPYSRRQTLLSKSLGAFGMDSTYACAIAITRQILAREVERVSARST